MIQIQLDEDDLAIAREIRIVLWGLAKAIDAKARQTACCERRWALGAAADMVRRAHGVLCELVFGEAPVPEHLELLLDDSSWPHPVAVLPPPRPSLEQLLAGLDHFDTEGDRSERVAEVRARLLELLLIEQRARGRRREHERRQRQRDEKAEG